MIACLHGYSALECRVTCPSARSFKQATSRLHHDRMPPRILGIGMPSYLPQARGPSSKRQAVCIMIACLHGYSALECRVTCPSARSLKQATSRLLHDRMPPRILGIGMPSYLPECDRVQRLSQERLGYAYM